MLVVALAVNLFSMVTPTMAQITVVLVPDVVGMSETDAESLVQSRGFTISWTYQNNNTVPEGHVISQDPAAGTWALEGSDVNLVVSLGPKALVVVLVPDVVGKRETDAESLRDRSLVGSSSWSAGASGGADAPPARPLACGCSPATTAGR